LADLSNTARTNPVDPVREGSSSAAAQAGERVREIVRRHVLPGGGLEIRRQVGDESDRLRGASDRLAAEPFANRGECLRERMSAAIGQRVGPQEIDERVAENGTPTRFEREIDEKCQVLAGPKPHHGAARIEEVGDAKQLQMMKSVHGNSTALWGRQGPSRVSTDLQHVVP
jgi:hypothetical protein